ncbi:MAG: hypothetical protein IPG00_14235 [Saprospiraceae bacterium]|nr:hypothetical protein [Saprospiraceae bacterium]
MKRNLIFSIAIIFLLVIIFISYQWCGKVPINMSGEDVVIGIAREEEWCCLPHRKESKINVKSNDLKADVQDKVEQIIEAKTEASSLKDKSPEDILKLYETFVTKYDKNNKTHQAELSRWTTDPLFLVLKNDGK